MNSKKFLYPFRANWLTILIGVLMLILVLVIGGWVYVQSKLDKLNFVGDENAPEEIWQDENGSDVGGIADLEYLNVLLLGTDEREAGGTTEDFSTEYQSGARADACMLLSLNLKKHTAKLISLERAIGVEIDEINGEDWLTHAFAYGGADAMLQAVREQFEIDVRRYARVNVSSAAQLIDAIGGVDIYLTETEAAALNGEIYTNSTTRNKVKPGMNHLDGFDALAYGRQRFIDSDFNRVQRQRNVLQAAIDQTKNLSIGELDDLLDVALPLVETNFTKKEINALMPKAIGFLGVELEQMTMPLPGMYGNKLTDDGRSMMMLDHEEAVRIMHEFCYEDTFDPESYEASDEVKARVWKAQQEAAYQWALEHPQEEPQEEETTEEDEPDYERPERKYPQQVDEDGNVISEPQEEEQEEADQPDYQASSQEQPHRVKVEGEEEASSSKDEDRPRVKVDRPADEENA